jgi:hypothetical protein
MISNCEARCLRFGFSCSQPQIMQQNEHCICTACLNESELEWCGTWSYALISRNNWRQVEHRIDSSILCIPKMRKWLRKSLRGCSGRYTVYLLAWTRYADSRFFTGSKRGSSANWPTYSAAPALERSSCLLVMPRRTRALMYHPVL